MLRFYSILSSLLVFLLLLDSIVAETTWVGMYTYDYVLNPVSPPVVFQDSRDPYTSTVLSDNSTEAWVNVTIPNEYIIALKSRSAVYWNDFSSDPFADNSMYVVSGVQGTNWYWDSSGYVVLSLSSTVGTSGEAIALFNMSLPPSSSITAVYVEYSVQIYSGSGWDDLIHYNTTNNYFYTSGFYYSIFSQSLGIYKWNGTWNTIAYTTVSASRGVWYDLTVAWFSNGTIAMYSGTTLLLSGTDTQIIPDVFGFGGYYSSGSFNAYFDNVIVSVNRKPYTVIVEGLQSGWTVNIYDSSGNLLSTATANATGVAVLDFWRYRFVPNATIEVLDTSGSLVANQTFSWVVGGDIYLLSNPVSTGVVLDLLDYVNLDSSNTYRTRLQLINYTVLQGSFTRCALHIEMDGQVSTDMDILAGDTNTSEIDLYPVYTGKIYIDLLGIPQSVIRINLLFVYRMNGDTVYYPVSITVYYGV